MDWLYAVMPIAGVNVWWPGLIILGLGVGIIGGFFGMGGAWMVTPGLNILGLPMAFAIGTDMAHMAGKSLISTMRHAKFGNVDYRLGLIMILGTIVGLEMGAEMVMWLERIGKVDLIVRWLYIIVLGLIAWMIFADVAKAKRKQREAAASGKVLDKLSTGIEWHKTLHKMRIPPMVHFKSAHVYCTVWLPILVGLVTGWLAGVLGIGGGLIAMPSLVYFVGCPTHVAVGTDLFQVMFTGLYGAGTYAYKGRVELVAALIMLLGAAVGAQIGTVATKYIKGYSIRVAFGVAVIGCGISVLMKLLPIYFPSWKGVMGISATVLILTLVSSLMLYIFILMVIGAKRELAMKRVAILGA